MACMLSVSPQPVLTFFAGLNVLFSSIPGRKNPSYQNVAFLAQILGDSAAVEPHSFRMFAFRCLISKFARTVFSEIETTSHPSSLLPRSDMHWFHYTSSFVLFYFRWRRILYSAVMRVQYCAVAQTIMLDECSSQTISARCNLLRSLRWDEIRVLSSETFYIKKTL